MPNDPTATPTFLIIGAPKGGTTDLFSQLTDASVNSGPERPDPPLLSGTKKEVALLHVAHLSPANFTPYAPVFRDYLALLRHPCANASSGSQMRECLAGPGSGASAYTLDATPGYYYAPGVPLLLRGFSPNSKVVLMLREPIDRLEALYHHWMVQDHMWPDTTLDELATAFFTLLATNPDAAAILRRLASCPAAAAATAAATASAAPIAAGSSGRSLSNHATPATPSGLAGNVGGPQLLRCQADSWRDLDALELLENHGHRLFLSGMYGYALAAWRLHYFTPGRLLVVDSHAYFRDREAVMEKVISFMYGRAMTSAERALARNAPAKNVKNRFNTTSPSSSSSSSSSSAAASSASPSSTVGDDGGAGGDGNGGDGGAGLQAPPFPPPGPKQPVWMLSPANRQELQRLYDTHLRPRLRRTLEELRAEGAWIVGFDGPPWPWAAEAADSK
ncbi:hypothetical protein PLESTM_000675700 [Pleodorina starrii]|nr:hypothetical protein PLESTM_000675700 [Pleodorina starrii]